MKYGEAVQAIAVVAGFVIGFPLSMLVYFGGAYFAFAGYEEESGSVVGGILWLMIIGPLVMIPTGIAVLIVAFTIGAIFAPFAMAVGATLRRLRQPPQPPPTPPSQPPPPPGPYTH